MDENFRIEKKINSGGLLDTDLFYSKEKDKALSVSDLEKYKIEKYIIPGNDFKDLNKTIKPAEFAFFYMKI